LQWSFRLRKTFFAQRKSEDLEREYERLLEEQFQLKQYGNLSIFEQSQMIAEDRAWWMRRLQKEFKEQKEAAEKSYRSNRK